MIINYFHCSDFLGLQRLNMKELENEKCEQDRQVFVAH